MPEKLDAKLKPAPRTPRSELCLYRERTQGLLRRYLRLSLEAGRLPSVLGREFFRARATSYRLHSFEDTVIFVHDVERALESLDEFSRQLIARSVLQEYSQAQVAMLLGCTRRTVSRRLPEALDELSAVFLARRLLTAFGAEPRPEECCQEEEIGDDGVICSSIAS
jgi:RNA polymerase sigma factor (sigma-70 family)